MYNVTLKDVAKKAKVSVMTVSRVINNKPDVNVDTKNRILKILKDMGYIPNSTARVLKGADSNRIGVVVSDIKNPFYSEMVGELEDIAGTKGLSVVMADTNKRMEGEVAAINSLISTYVDFLIIAPEGYKTNHLDELKKRGISFFSFGVHFPQKDYTEVWIDDENGGGQVGEYFAKIGVSKPLLIMGNPKKTTTLSRTRGFQAGYERNGGRKENVDIVNLEVDWKSSERFVVENFKSKKYDSIFCYNDLMALGAMRGLGKIGMTVGKNLPLIGYDDVSIAEIVGLTTVKIPVSEMLKSLFELIAGGKEGKVKFIPDLIFRETA